MAESRNKRVWRSHTGSSSFFWNSELSEERKLEIINWIANMEEAQRAMLNDLLDDVRAEERFYAYQSESE